MIIRTFYIISFILASLPLLSQENYPVRWDFSGQSFSDFVKKTESVYPVRFFYEEEWISDLKLGDYGNKRTLNEILDTLFSGKQIRYYSAGNGNIILTKTLSIKALKEKTDPGMIYISGSMDYEGSGTEASSRTTRTEVGNPAERNKTGSVTLSGYVKNQDNHEPVPGVTVFIPKLTSGAISNEHGYYKLNIPRGEYLIRFTFVGMKEKQISLSLYGTGELDVEMNSVLIPLKEAVITAEKDLTLRRLETGVEKISMASIRMMPSSMGEPDIIKSVLLVPGVTSVGEGTPGFNVRGGSADQNLVLLYGAPVYNTSHFFGFFSAINPDIISDATLYKGGIPARYGGRLSSVLEIVPKEGNRREFAGNAGISPVTAHIACEGPIIRDTLYYLVAARTTYSNWILRFIDDPALNKSRAFFNDLNGRIAWDIDRRNKIDLSAYYSYDAFRLNSDTTYHYQNLIGSFRWRHFFSNNLFSSLLVTNSLYRYDISSTRVPAEAFNLTHRINSTAFKGDFNWFQGRNEFNFGIDLTGYGVVPGNYLPDGDSSIVIPNSIERQRAIEGAVYIEDKITLSNRISLNAGVRLSAFSAIGPQTVFIYSPEMPVNVSSVTDTVFYKKNKPYKTYGGPELRLSANIRISESSSLRAGYNHTHQYMHLLSNTAAISPTDTWKLSDYNIKPQSADQVSAGYYRRIDNNRIEVTAETYYKWIDNMIDFKGGTNLTMNDHIETDLINVNGKAYGIELLVRKPEGRIRWSAGYTYSRILLKSKGSFSEELINSGNWFPANYDRPHSVICTFSYVPSRRVNLTVDYNFTSGRPVTYPVSSYAIGDIIITNYSDRNSYRIPYYSRLDLSVSISGNLKSHKIANPHWIFSIYNVTGRNNVYSVYFKYVNNSVNGYYLSIFDRPIPSLSFNFDF